MAGIIGIIELGYAKSNAPWPLVASNRAVGCVRRRQRGIISGTSSLARGRETRQGRQTAREPDMSYLGILALLSLLIVTSSAIWSII
jgi:hypothetical protein